MAVIAKVMFNDRQNKAGGRVLVGQEKQMRRQEQHSITARGLLISLFTLLPTLMDVSD